MHRALWLFAFLLVLAPRALAFSGEGRQIVATIAAGEPRPAGDPATWARGWATGSLAHAKVIYGQPTLTGPDDRRGWDVTPAGGFEARAAEMIEEQLLKGGLRLAQLLDSTSKE